MSDSQEFLHVQITDKMMARIVSREWKPGREVTPVTQLAREYRVSTGTVRHALKTLQARGLVTVEMGLWVRTQAEPAPGGGR